MKALILLLLVPVLSWAQYFNTPACNIIGCLVNHHDGDWKGVIEADSIQWMHPALIVYDEHKHTSGGPCGSELFYGDNPNMLYGRCEKCNEKYAVMERKPDASNAAQSANSVFSLWGGLRVGAEYLQQFTKPYGATVGICGEARFNLSKDLSAGFKVLLPVGMDDANFRIMLDKRLF